MSIRQPALPVSSTLLHRSRSFALGIALVLGGCGGGSSTGSLGGDTELSGEGGGFNGPLSGRLLIERHLLDLSTGDDSDLIVQNTVRVNRGVSAASDGRAFYYTELNCRDRPGFASYGCVVVLDAAFNEIDRIDPGLDLSSNAPEVSPDGRYFGVSTVDIQGPVAIFGTDGQILDEADRANVQSRMSWAPDGSFYYGKDNAIYRAQVGTDPSNDELVHRFDAEDGSVNTLAVSPDGARLAVEMDTGEGLTEPETSIWMLDADGGNPHQFATARSIPTVRYPVWSPDGRWLLVGAGGFFLAIGRPNPAENISGGLFALDTNVQTHIVDDLGSGSSATQRRILSNCHGAGEASCELDSQFVSGWIR